MTKNESMKLVELKNMYNQLVKVYEEEYRKSERLKEIDKVESEVYRRKADQHYGEAEGIQYALSMFGA